MIEVPGYSIQRELGRGGMATVYLAVQLSLARHVALKVLDPRLAAEPGFTARFLREGRIAASLRHRHILAIHDVGVHADTAYLALEYLPSGSVAAEIGSMAPREALRLVREIAMALQHAHRNGIVHRDVKPENILRNEDGSFVLADFGIAHFANAAHSFTPHGPSAGTPAYMAPEQWRNLAVDGRTDLYSLGIVLYQLLTAELPFTGADSWAIGMQHLTAPLPRLPAPLAGAQDLLASLLAKHPADRIADGGQIAERIAELERALALPAVPALGGAAQKLSTSRLLREWPHRAAAAWFQTGGVRRAAAQRNFKIVGALLFGAAVLLGLLWSTLSDRGRPLWEALTTPADKLATIAVMPCVNYAAAGDFDAFGDVLAEELIHRLSRLRALTVIARSSSFPLRDQALTASALGARLGASHLLSCSIRRSPDGVRIAAELVDTANDRQQWSVEYDRSAEELLAVVDELALGISEKLLVSLAGAERARLIRHRTESLTAILYVERARALAIEGNRTSLAEARKLIDQAFALDPNYALAHTALADVLSAQARLEQHDPSWWRTQVQPLLQRALQLDPELAAAYVLRSQLHCAEFDWSACRADIDRALTLEPGSADVQAAAAAYHRTLGSRERGVAHALQLARIEPELPMAWDTLVAAYLSAGHHGDALHIAERSVARFPEHWPAQRLLAMSLEALGRCAEGLRAHERALALSDADIEVNSSAASLYVCAGQGARAEALLRDFEVRRASADPVGAMGFASMHLALGDKTAALDALEAMYTVRDRRLCDWITSAQFGIEALGGEPRFIALVERLALPTGAMQWDYRRKH